MVALQNIGCFLRLKFFLTYQESQKYILLIDRMKAIWGKVSYV